MQRLILFIGLSLFTLHACGDTSYDSYSGQSDATSGPRVSVPVDMSLFPGNLSASDNFNTVTLPLEVSESYDLVPIQIGAKIFELNGHDPEYIRVEFSSNRVEWVGYTVDSIGIYESEEVCLENEDYCEEVIVGEGKSGYFEINDGYIAIQNAYCRYDISSYDYTISAIAYDLSFWPAERISQPIEIQINCEMIE